MFPSSEGEIITQSLPGLEFKDMQYRLFDVLRYRITNVCVPQTITSDQVNPGG